MLFSSSFITFFLLAIPTTFSRYSRTFLQYMYDILWLGINNSYLNNIWSTIPQITKKNNEQLVKNRQFILTPHCHKNNLNLRVRTEPSLLDQMQLFLVTNRTCQYTVASAPTVKSSVFMRRFRFFLDFSPGQPYANTLSYIVQNIFTNAKKCLELFYSVNVEILFTKSA